MHVVTTYARRFYCCISFFFNDPATTEIYTLSLHDALPISGGDGDEVPAQRRAAGDGVPFAGKRAGGAEDRKSTRLNSSHMSISYAVFCLKKKKHGRRLRRLGGNRRIDRHLT